jgi:hypothetical protein
MFTKFHRNWQTVPMILLSVQFISLICEFSKMPHTRTSYYLIDEAQLQKNLEIIQYMRELSGAK